VQAAAAAGGAVVETVGSIWTNPFDQCVRMSSFTAVCMSLVLFSVFIYVLLDSGRRVLCCATAASSQVEGTLPSRRIPTSRRRTGTKI
jgi:hypothetical protein